MSVETVRVFIQRFGKAIKKYGDSKFPLESMFLKINSDLNKISLNGQDEIDQVRESIYELEDFLSECQALSKRRVERKRSLMNCYSPKEFFYINRTKIALRKIHKTLQALQKESTTPREDKQETGTPEAQTEYEWSYGSVDISKIYGWDEEVEEINKTLLRDGHDGLNKVGIVGNFGSGKTALAQKIFMSEAIMDNFCLRLWVCVSPDCEPTELVLRMLENLGVEDVESILADKGEREELGVLLFVLHCQLLDKRYLIVFDDIGKANAWHTNLDEQPPETREWTDRLAYGLPKGDCSAIIVTSRAPEVARKMVGRMNIHHPTRIYGENGWKVFKSAYEEVQTPFDESLELLRDEIIRKCDGLPLALKTAGMELARQPKDDKLITEKLEEDEPNKPPTEDLTTPNIDDSEKPQAIESATPQAEEKVEGQGDETNEKPQGETIDETHEKPQAEKGDEPNEKPIQDEKSDKQGDETSEKPQAEKSDETNKQEMPENDYTPQHKVEDVVESKPSEIDDTDKPQAPSTNA